MGVPLLRPVLQVRDGRERGASSEIPEGVAHAARRGCSLHAVQLIRVTHAPARRLALCAAGGGLGSQRGGCTETRPLTQELRAAPCRPPLDPVGWLRGARAPDHSLHRPLVRWPGWRLVPACGNQEVDARRSVDEQARPGEYWAEAMRGPHLKAGDVTGASRPRPESVPWRVRARSPRGALADVKIQLTGPTRPAGCPEPTGAVDGRWAVSCHVEARCGVKSCFQFYTPQGSAWEVTRGPN